MTKLSKLSSANFFNVLVSLKTWFIMLDGDWPNVLETMDLNNDDMADLYCYRSKLFVQSWSEQCGHMAQLDAIYLNAIDCCCS